MAQTTDITQKWIKLALLKSSLRYGLLCFENSIRDVPFEDRERVWYQFLKLKAVMWQVVGAMHGSIGSVCTTSFYEVTTKNIIDPICSGFECIFVCCCSIAHVCIVMVVTESDF